MPNISVHARKSGPITSISERHNSNKFAIQCKWTAAISLTSITLIISGTNIRWRYNCSAVSLPARARIDYRHIDVLQSIRWHISSLPNISPSRHHRRTSSCIRDSQRGQTNWLDRCGIDERPCQYENGRIICHCLLVKQRMYYEFRDVHCAATERYQICDARSDRCASYIHTLGAMGSC